MLGSKLKLIFEASLILILFGAMIIPSLLNIQIVPMVAADPEPPVIITGNDLNNTEPGYPEWWLPKEPKEPENPNNPGWWEKINEVMPWEILPQWYYLLFEDHVYNLTCTDPV